jgi:hypothetical protein
LQFAPVRLDLRGYSVFGRTGRYQSARMDPILLSGPFAETERPAPGMPAAESVKVLDFPQENAAGRGSQVKWTDSSAHRKNGPQGRVRHRGRGCVSIILEQKRLDRADGAERF